ncbi:MAG: HAD-IIA family hydrolase [Lachnospiraceae bacterium]|nr:HAD-IIA family hydrolase [Lachnospiraceae bacterium]
MSSLQAKKLFLLDMDGTLYLDETLFDGVPEFLARIRAKGGRYLFLTNNSSRGIEGYLKKMARLGIPAEEEDFLTSTDATIRTIRKEYPDRLIYVVGTQSLKEQLRSAGLCLSEEPSEDVNLLLIGFDRELTYKKLEDACILLGRNVDYLATNPDWVCPVAFGFEPDCGSICEMLWHATGKKPRVIGKPEPQMVFLALERTGFTKEETVVVGDRLYTDIACGVNAGVDTVFVLSGEGKREDIETMGIRPVWVLADIRSLLEEMEKDDGKA